MIFIRVSNVAFEVLIETSGEKTRWLLKVGVGIREIRRVIWAVNCREVRDKDIKMVLREQRNWKREE